MKNMRQLGRCYGNQGWAKAVEIFLKISLFKMSESFKSVALGVLEEVYLVVGGGGGGECAGIGLMEILAQPLSHLDACNKQGT